MANINNEIFLDMLASAANNLCNHRQEVDNMNVFPVPDGDTGSNMSMTISSCVKNIDDLRGRTLEDISKSIARREGKFGRNTFSADKRTAKEPCRFGRGGLRRGCDCF